MDCGVFGRPPLDVMLNVTSTSKLRELFRLFKVGCAIWAQMSQIGVSQIKAPIGNIFQKYVYSSFMVKVRIDSGSCGLFWFILGWG